MELKDEFIHRDDLTAMLAGILHCSAPHIQKRVMVRPDFPSAYKIGAQNLFKLAEVQQWIESQKVVRAK